MPDRAYRLARDGAEAAVEHLGGAWHELQAARGCLLDVPDAPAVAGRVADLAAGVHRLWVDLGFDETAEGPTPRERRRAEAGEARAEEPEIMLVQFRGHDFRLTFGRHGSRASLSCEVLTAGRWREWTGFDVPENTQKFQLGLAWLYRYASDHAAGAEEG